MDVFTMSTHVDASDLDHVDSGEGQGPCDGAVDLRQDAQRPSKSDQAY